MKTAEVSFSVLRKLRYVTNENTRTDEVYEITKVASKHAAGGMSMILVAST